MTRKKTQLIKVKCNEAFKNEVVVVAETNDLTASDLTRRALKYFLLKIKQGSVIL